MGSKSESEGENTCVEVFVAGTVLVGPLQLHLVVENVAVVEMVMVVTKVAVVQMVMVVENVAAVEVVMQETEDCRGRTWFYENYGALRDVHQNHLSEMLALLTGTDESRCKRGVPTS